MKNTSVKEALQYMCTLPSEEQFQFDFASILIEKHKYAAPNPE